LECSQNACNCWENLEFNLSPTFYKTLLLYLHDDKKLKREDAGKSMQSLANLFPLEVDGMLKQMGILYKQFEKVFNFFRGNFKKMLLKKSGLFSFQDNF